MNSPKLLIGTCVFALMFAPGLASAQTVPDASEPTQGIQDIIVTAQRRSENLQRAALAVSAVGGDDIRKAGVTTTTQLTTLVPSLQVSGTQFYLRGVGNFTSNALSDSAVAFNFANVVVGRPSGTAGFFYDLDRIEVLKGPQGTLYGRNATGGAINIIPRGAKLGEFSGEAMAEYGNYNAYRIDGAVNVPLGQSAALRAAVNYIKHDGYLNDGTFDQDDLSGRLSLLVEPATNLKINVVGDYAQTRGKGGGTVILEQGVKNRFGVLSPQGQAFYATQPNFVLGRNFVPLTTSPYVHNDNWGLSATIDWNIPIGTITVIPAYRSTDIDYLTIGGGFQLGSKEHNTQTSLEARFASDDSKPLRFLVGTFIFDERIKVKAFDVNAQANGSRQSYENSTKSMAAFGRVTYAPVPELRFTVGGRFTTEDKTINSRSNGFTRVCTNAPTFFPVFALGCPNAQIVPFNDFSQPPADFNPFPDGTITIPSAFTKNARASFERVTYRLGADWDITSRNLLYASYETGFKSGGFFNAPTRNTFRPETIGAYTIGSKNRFFDNKLQVNLEGFYWIYRDQQISHLGIDENGNTSFPTENVGKSTVKGIEAEISFLPARNTLLSVDAQYLAAKYDNFIYTTPNQNSGAGNGTGCPNQSVTSIAYIVNCSGRRPPNSPEWTINLGAQQSFDFQSGAKVIANARSHFQTKTLTSQSFLPIQVQDAYWTVDASLTYSAPGDRYFLSGFINNAFNETVLGNTDTVAFGSFNIGSIRPPRVYGVRAGARAFSKQMASSAGSENAENKRQIEHDPIQSDRIML